MATGYIIWEQSSKTVVGGAQPLVFAVQADANAQITVLQKQSQRSDDSHRKPLPVWTSVAVTV